MSETDPLVPAVPFVDTLTDTGTPAENLPEAGLTSNRFMVYVIELMLNVPDVEVELTGVIAKVSDTVVVGANGVM